MSSTRHMLCTLLVMASTATLGTAALAANDGVPSAAPATPQGTMSPAAPQAGSTPQTATPDTRTCRQAKAKTRPQLTPEQRAERRAARQSAIDQGITQPHKPRRAKLPLC